MCEIQVSLSTDGVLGAPSHGGPWRPGAASRPGAEPVVAKETRVRGASEVWRRPGRRGGGALPTPHRPISPRAAASPPAVLTPRRPSLRPALSCPQPRSPARSEAAVPPPCFGAHSRGGRNLTRTDARLPIPRAAPRPVSCLGRSRAVACRSRPRAWGRRPPPPWAVGRLSNARRSEPAGPH